MTFLRAFAIRADQDTINRRQVKVQEEVEIDNNKIYYHEEKMSTEVLNNEVENEDENFDLENGREE